MARNESPELKLLTRPEVEDAYGIGRRFLEVAAMRGEGPAYIKVGRSVRYRRVDVEAWILAQRVLTSGARGLDN